MISPGLAIGIMIWKNARVWEQPSTNAASWTAEGRVLKNACRKKTVNGSEKAM